MSRIVGPITRLFLIIFPPKMEKYWAVPPSSSMGFCYLSGGIEAEMYPIIFHSLYELLFYGLGDNDKYIDVSFLFSSPWVTKRFCGRDLILSL